jgi:hypothetical protein
MVLLSLSEQDRGMKERREGLLHSAFFSWLCVSEIGFFFLIPHFSPRLGETQHHHLLTIHNQEELLYMLYIHNHSITHSHEERRKKLNKTLSKDRPRWNTYHCFRQDAFVS